MLHVKQEAKRVSAWSADFFNRLASPESSVAALAEQLLRAILRGRRSKKPLRL